MNSDEQKILCRARSDYTLELIMGFESQKERGVESHATAAAHKSANRIFAGTIVSLDISLTVDACLQQADQCILSNISTAFKLSTSVTAASMSIKIL